jgi:hypothetical protein
MIADLRKWQKVPPAMGCIWDHLSLSIKMTYYPYSWHHYKNIRHIFSPQALKILDIIPWQG